MRFEYDISAEEYASGQLLYYKLSTPNRVSCSARWIFSGCVLLAVAAMQPVWDLPIYLLVGAGLVWIYSGFGVLSPRRLLKDHFSTTGLSGKSFQADLNETAFEVVHPDCTWHVQWSGVSAKGEDDKVFMVFGGNTIFMWGKRHLSAEQQEELRRLAGIPRA